MDFLNQSIGQVSDLFRSMTPGARITAGLLLAVVVVSVGYLFQHQKSGPDEFLFGGVYLPDGQLTRIEAAIGQAGLSNFRRQGNRILVPRGEKAVYLAAVADAGALPANFHTYLETAIDEGGPWESSTAKRMRMQVAKQSMLSDIIRNMDWVEDAVVIYDEQAARGLSTTKLVTASVNIKPVLGEMLDTRRATKVQKLIAHSVVGMAEADVAVTSLGSDGVVDGTIYADDFDSEYYQARVSYEQYKRQSILNALRDIEGVRVEVSAVVDSIVEESFSNVKPDPKSVTDHEFTNSETTERNNVDAGGRVGVVAQGPGRRGDTEQFSQQNVDKTSSEQSEADYLVGHEQTRHMRAGFTPKEVWATVTVPRSYIERVWRQRHPEVAEPPQDEDMRIVQEEVTTKVENIVAPLLDRQNRGENQYKQVQVVVLDSIVPPAIAPATLADTALAWSGRHWSTLAMIGVAIFSLLVLRSVVSASPTGGGSSAALAEPIAVPSSAEGERQDEPEPEEPPRTRLRIKKGTSLRDDLADMVKDDPEAAAAILRSWIGKAG